LVLEGLALKLCEVNLLELGALAGHQVGGLTPALALPRGEHASAADLVVKGDGVMCGFGVLD